MTLGTAFLVYFYTQALFQPLHMISNQLEDFQKASAGAVRVRELMSTSSALADGITQGAAGPDEFRTAPLWGVGQRIFFLHDGRATDLAQAIASHRSPGSEASAVIRSFERLRTQQQQDVVNFLRSL